ncbi:glutaminase [Microbacterium jejuense]|uniref:Glutaminase n=1 Tax=Microbacterium jejuense TaxID=1263637 RepID=A0ABS7HS79_9MICO|nr:glutaminase [Microbacterium jejuense]MBW9095600.1 glutaminase [Microbacterium jejuense]
MSTLELLDTARARLAAGGAAREALGELVVPRRILGVARAPRVERRGSAWHLGALLLTDDAVLATGEVVRARQEARRGYTAESQRQRSELAFAARRGGFAEGETVHVGWRVLSADTPDAPLALRDGIPSIRWSAAGALMPLDAYLAERVSLLLEPPAGA